MISYSRFAIPLFVALVTNSSSIGQTVLYDFDDFNDPFGHFGAVTTDSGLLLDCGEIGNVCTSHTGDFTENIFSPNDFGMVEIGPFFGEPTTIDLSGFIGYSIDARFIRDIDGVPGSGPTEFTGLSPIKFGLQWDPSDPCNGSMDECSDLYDTPVELTEEFTTYTVMFDDFLEGRPRNSAQIKMLMLTGEIDPDTGIKLPGTDWSDGVGRLEFDNVIGILPSSVDGDYNGNNVVDSADYAVWLNTLGSTDDLRADGDGSLTVDRVDFEFWKTRVGNTAGTGTAMASATVPEPTAVTLIVGLFSCFLPVGGRSRPNATS